MISGDPGILLQGENTYAGRTSDPHQRHGLLGYAGASAALQEGNRGTCPDTQRSVRNCIRSAQAVIETDNEMQQIKNKIGMFHDI